MEGPGPGGAALLPRVLGYLWPHRARAAGGVALTLLGIGFELLKPVPLAVVLDTVLGGQSPPAPLRGLAGLGSSGLLAAAAASIVAIAVGLGACTVGANYLTIDVGQRMVNDLRTRLYGHLQRLSLGFHYRQQTGDLLYRVVADTYSIQSMVMNGVLPLGSAVLMLAGMFAVMLRYNAPLAVATLLVAPPLYLAITRLSARIHSAALASKQAESELYAQAATGIDAVKLVQAYGREQGTLDEFRRGSERSLALTLRLYNHETLFILVVDSLLAAGTALLVWLGAREVMAGRLSVGALTVFLAYLKDMYRPVRDMAQNLKELSSSRAGLERVFAVLDVQPDVEDAPGARPLAAAAGELRFENVTFAYDTGGPVLRNVDLRIAPGETVALVGRTGAGKSTLASLVLRFFDPQQGRVTLDGHDLRELTLSSLRRQVTLMLQEPILFRASVFDNIAFSAPGAGPDEVRLAARRAEAERFILELPQGYDTVLGQDGMTLSGGQRQRLALARALLRDAPVVVLDEPTSALDLATEADVWRNVEELLRGKTAIIIAHRLSTARLADRIVVLERGEIAEQGRHEELLALGGRYARLWGRHSASQQQTDLLLAEQA